MISPYNVKNSPSTLMHPYRLETNFKNRALAFATIHKYQFPLLHCFRMQRINLEMWLVDFPKSFPRLVLRSQTSLTCWADRLYLHHGYYGRPFSNSVPFGDTPHSRYVIIAHILPTGSELLGAKCVSPIRTESQYVLLPRTESHQCYQLTPRIATDCCAICCTLSLLPVLPSTKK
jgi:hypothetical protein